MTIDSKIPIQEFAANCNGQMIPLNQAVSYFSVLPLDDRDLRRLIYDPVEAAPPKIAEIVPNLRLVVVPYLEKPTAARSSKHRDSDKNGSSAKKAKKPTALVSYERPPQNRRLLAAHVDWKSDTYLFLAIRDEEVADYHYTLYSGLADLITERADEEQVERFFDVLRDELKRDAHGEIDDKSWKLKEQLIQRQSDLAKETKLLKNYFQQAMSDTLVLYLHGLCCDIDVESGPRQLASRFVRRRLERLRDLLPPPAGVALFPEELPPT